jgi:hypothetical protein
MGSSPVDQFSLLHFAVGIIAYFWGITAWQILSLHLLFEFVENTETGVHIINKYITFWPGGKPGPDPVTNSIMDTVCTMGGWWFTRWVDSMSRHHHLYP